MLAGIKGRLVARKEGRVYITNNGLTYEVLVPSIIFQKLREYSLGEEIELVASTYYLQEKNLMRPLIVGFFSELEKDFFEMFIGVSGFSVKGVLSALNKPISKIAEAIEEQNIDFLSTLPGVGKRKVYHILARLKGKVSRFMLIPDREFSAKGKEEEKFKEMEEEALQILLQLQYSRQEAKARIRKVLASGRKIDSTEELLNEIYRFQ